MAFEPVYEKVSLKGGKGLGSERIKIECKTDVSTDSIDKIINVNVSAGITEATANDGAAKYNGKAVFYICYQDVEGNVKKCESAVDFSGEVFIENLNAGDRLETRIEYERAEGDKGGIKLSAYAYITILVKAHGDNTFTHVTGGEGLVINSTVKEVNKSFGLCYGNYPVEEEYELDYAVAEVVYQRATPLITSVQCGVGCIIVDGSVLLSSILLQSGDKKDIIKENRTVAYRAEIECEEAMPSCSARAQVCVKNFKTDVTVDEEKNKSAITALVTLNFSCEAFCSEEISLVEDAFSLTDNVKIELADFVSEKCCQQKSTTIKGCGRVENARINEGYLPVCACGERVEVVSVSQTEKGVLVTGTLSMNGIFRGEDGRLASVPLETVFETEIDYALPQNAKIDVVAVAEQGAIQLVTQTEVELCAEITLTVFPREQMVIKHLKEVCCTGVKPINDCPISVYIPLENEELWSLAKRLNVAPNELIETNKELQFPLTGKERIVVYRQK